MKNDSLFKAALLAVSVLASMAAGAQTIQVFNEPFVEKPALPFASPNQPRASNKVAPVIVEAPPVPAPAATFELVKGKRVDEQFKAFGKRSGWDLFWQAPEYVLDQNMQIQGDFETSLLNFLQGANVAGSRLRAHFYRGNKTVRVMEF